MLLALGVVTVGVAAPASAHTNVVSAAVSCTPDYKWQITWTVTNDYNDSEIITTADAPVVVGTTIAATNKTSTGRASFVETVATPVAKKVSVTGEWKKDNFAMTASGSVKVTDFVGQCTAPKPPVVQSTGLYLYKKLDPTKDASWPNSGYQTKITTWDGWSYKTIYPSTLPSNVCGPGWGVQQDQINGAQSLFHDSILYPNDGGFAAGVLHASLHSNLSALVKVPACAPIPHVTVTTGACYANGDHSSANVYVALSNTGNAPVTFTSSNGINVTLQGGESKKVEASPIWNAGGTFDVVAKGVGFTQTFPITIPAFTDCGAVVTPNASIVTGVCVYSEGNSTADFRTVKITFDNSSSNRSVIFTVASFPQYNKTLAAGEKYSFDAANIYAAGGGYTVTAGGKTFDLVIAPCPTIVKPVAPAATDINKCGTDGSVVLPTTTGISYSLTTGDGKSGAWVVTAVPTAGYRFAGTVQTATFSGDLGARIDCPVVTVCSSIGDGGTSTDLNHNGWDFSQTRATGHNAYVAGGLHVYTEGTTSTDKAAGYHPISIPLTGVGTPSIDLVNSGFSTPGLQLLVDLNNDGVVDGTLVGESVYGTDWWLTDGSAQLAKDGAPSHSGGFGSTNHGTLDAWLASFPTAHVLGFGYSLGSGVLGDLVIKSITVGCNSYHFDHGIVVVPPTPHSNIVATCTTSGASTDVFVSNDFTPSKFTVGADFEAEIFVNGVLRDTVTVQSGAVASKHYDFTSNTGEYTVVVKVDGKTIAEKVVDSACALATEADPSPQTCVNDELVDGQIHVLLNAHLVYKIDGVVVTQANTTVTPGSHTVTAKLADPSGIYVLSGQSSWTFTSAAFDGTCEPPTLALVTPTASSKAITCDTQGSYTLDNVEGVTWLVEGVAKAAGTYPVTSAATVHAVATVDPSVNGFEQDAQTSWTFTFTDPADCGELTTHPLVTPVVSQVTRTCTANGSYTLTAVEGVVYTVNGTVQAAGTYPVSTAKTVAVIASTVSSDFGFEEGAQTTWNLVFTDPANCGELTTLAFTGSNGTLAGGLLLGLIFVMFGAGVITVSRVRKRNS